MIGEWEMSEDGNMNEEIDSEWHHLRTNKVFINIRIEELKVICYTVKTLTVDFVPHFSHFWEETELVLGMLGVKSARFPRIRGSHFYAK